MALAELQHHGQSFKEDFASNRTAEHQQTLRICSDTFINLINTASKSNEIKVSFFSLKTNQTNTHVYKNLTGTRNHACLTYIFIVSLK